MEIISALILGLVGSFHCLGMCGPLALAIPHARRDRLSMVLDATIYNGGRILMYASLGYLIGWLGVSVRLAGYQQALSIIVGMVILAGVAVPVIMRRFRFALTYSNSIFSFFRKIFRKLLGTPGASSLFSLGLINGLLPCGLVYAALGASATTGDTIQSSIYMALFGAGTFPMMFGAVFFGAMVSGEWRRRALRLVPVGLVVVSLLLILRGMSLGIPYVSPKISETHTMQGDCCQPGTH